MVRDSLRGFLQIGFFLSAGSLCSVVSVPRDSGEFVISVCSGAIGLTMIGGSILAWRLLR